MARIAFRISEICQQATSRVERMDGLIGRIGNTGQVAVRIQAQGGALAKGPNDRSGFPTGITLDSRDVAIPVRYLREAARTVIGKLITDRPCEGIERALMLTSTVEDVDSTP